MASIHALVEGSPKAKYVVLPKLDIAVDEKSFIPIKSPATLKTSPPESPVAARAFRVSPASSLPNRVD